MNVAVIVDDDYEALKHSLSIIKSTGQFRQIKGFCHPDKAYNFIKENGCDVFFVETEIKDINCFVLINKLREEINKNIFFIIVTEKEEYAYEALRKDILGYILKPLSLEEISKTLKRLKQNYRGFKTLDFK